MRKTRTNKVVCYVVVQGHLLVFQHLDQPVEEVGVQVPAGTIKPGEDPADAALREAQEETGLTGLRVVGKLGERDYDTSPYRFEVAHRQFFELTTEHVDLSQTWIAGELDPEGGEDSPNWQCWWTPLDKAHVLAAGLSEMVGSLFPASVAPPI